MINKTKDYDQFIFREDNRQRIIEWHVKRLAESIKSKNMLEFRPIIVNDQMEIIDGQHRLKAAELLGVEIYYQVEANLDAADIIKMNIALNWRMGDYLNFYCQHHYPDYLKLQEFMRKYALNLKIALAIAIGAGHKGYESFKEGKFKYNESFLDHDLTICWQTIDYIKKMNGYSTYTDSGRFWKALIRLVQHEGFDSKKWINNVKVMISHFTPKAGVEDYINLFQKIYNFRNQNKIKLMEKD